MTCLYGPTKGLGEHKFCERLEKDYFAPKTRRGKVRLRSGRMQDAEFDGCARKSMTWVLRYHHSPSFQAPSCRKVKKIY